MRSRPPFLAMLALALMCRPACPAPDIAFAAISQALAKGEGAVAFQLADTALARTDLNEADRARLIEERGLARDLQGDKDAALADLTTALGAKSLTAEDLSRFYLERGLILDGMNRLDDAAGDYSAALSLVPESAPALNNRANIFRRQNRFEEARRDYLASLAADNPAPEYPYYGLGQVAESEGKADEAKAFYARAVAANPGYALAVTRLAALGGAPPAQQAITLRPPVEAGGETATLVLHPPKRLPAVPSKAATAAQAPPGIKPADYSGRENRPGLRPALDNSAGGKRTQQVQLGAWRTEAEAAEAWMGDVKKAGSALAPLAPRIVAADLPGKGRYYRLRVETADAAQLCNALAAKGLDCILARD